MTAGGIPGRVLALDVGSVRVGAAISDPMRTIAQPLGVWQVNGGGQNGGWRREFEAAVEKYAPTLVLVGLPRRTTGETGPEGERILSLLEFMRGEYPDLAFETWDERFTTVIAQRALIEGGMSRSGRKNHVDKVAAVLILQSWLESDSGGG